MTVDAFEFVRTAIVEAQRRADDELCDGVLRPDRPGLGERGDACGDVDRDSSDVVASERPSRSVASRGRRRCRTAPSTRD